MKIVAFLQNQWFNDPDGARRLFEKPRDGMAPEALRERLIASFLFMGCLTGRRLRTAFGEGWTEQIIWEEVSREIGGKSSSAFPADLHHICDVLDRHRPTHVLAFGRIASDALKQHFSGFVFQNYSFDLITGPHPAARHATVMSELRSMREQLDALAAECFDVIQATEGC